MNYIRPTTLDPIIHISKNAIKNVVTYYSYNFMHCLTKNYKHYLEYMLLRCASLVPTVSLVMWNLSCYIRISFHFEID